LPMPQPHTSWLIGSAAECDIQVGSPYVSGRHCRLTLDNGTWTLEDLGSTNGTYVNGSRLVGTTAVTPADRITLGTSTALPWPPRPADGPTADTIPLPEPRRPVMIGRSPVCDVVLLLPMVSSRHAILEPVDDGWQIRDLGSTNGTFVEGRRIDGPTPVGTGDVIGLGSFRLKLTADGGSLVERSPGQSVLEAREVGVAVEGHRLIRDISLVVCPGELVAIMGPSGAGKSTLLATLVGGRQPDEGYVLLGGEDLYARFDEFRGQIGYVPQDDIMHPELTVSQAVWFGARLRLPRDYSDAEIERRVATVIDELGLTGCEHVRIGSADRRGISGGQRKRVNVALELITDPPMLVLDEPTSGLSSTDALALLKLLRRLAQGGKTIVLTIHQPGAEAMRQLDGVAVIARDASTRDVGHLAWYGAAVPDSVRFFEPRGRPDDAEAVLRGLATRPVADWEAEYRRSDTFQEWVTRRRSLGPAGHSPAPRRGAPPLELLSQWWTLVRRSLVVKAADRWTTAILLVQAPVIAFLVAGVFGRRAAAPLELATWADSAKALATTTFLMALAAIWFGCSNAAREIVAERAIFKRERMVGLSPGAYLASKLIVLAGLCAIQCGILLAIVRAGCRLEAPASGAWLTLFLAANVAVVIGLCVSAVVRSAEAAASVLPLVILPMVILGGILLPIADLPGPGNFLADAMPSRWAFEGLLVGEANARAIIELPPPSDSRASDEPQIEDLAESWFPRDGWRSGSDVPAWMLAGMWVIGVIGLRQVLRQT
jgi:ABC-type multidrug transport system ATPase subunit/pSer/pThr/pTyr-binding forkhead associated (FHA) protein